jgi:cell wall-associated NlpC family hydrolase
VSFSQGGRTYQLGMAAVCTVLAASGFVAAGYADNSVADAAAAASALSPARTSAVSSGFGPATASAFPSPDAHISLTFARTLILAQKPKPALILDLSKTNRGWPVSAGTVLGGTPEYSPDMISTVRREILQAAYTGLGHSYVWGGTSFDRGWDCSGFVQWAYAQAGIALPRTEQWLPMVPTNNPQPGDIVVQNPDGPHHWSHIGIYVGHGEMISALNPSVGTVMHTPQSTSSSSTYFTMPGFAILDEQAAKAAKAAAAAKAGAPKPATSAAVPKPKPSTTANPAPSHSPSPTPVPSPSPSMSPTPTPSPTRPPSPTPSMSPTPTPGTEPAPTETTAPATTPPATSPAASAPPETPSPVETATQTPTPAAATPTPR